MAKEKKLPKFVEYRECFKPGVVVVQLPILVVSEANNTEHWSVRNRRHAEQKAFVTSALRYLSAFVAPPCEVHLTRFAPRLLDSDNLVYGFKWIRDAIAACLTMNWRPGAADNHPLISWHYDQVKQPLCGICLSMKFVTLEPGVKEALKSCVIGGDSIK